MTSLKSTVFKNLNPYYGDIHNHCNISYGHGSLNDALYNARLQLDFVSVTVHAVWPDLPTDDPDLQYLVNYHEEGFKHAKAGWNTYLTTIDENNADGEFVTYPSFEWHSLEYGDHCVYYLNTDNDTPIIDAPDLQALRDILHDLKTPTLLIPHHIGYKQGFRGINWKTFTDELSPVVEIFSFHGLSESSEGPYPYLHSMGPVHEHSTAQYGWEQNNVFGVVGSTDHHNAFPGSYGYGRLAVWSEALTRDAIWNAIKQRQTVVLTGDRIELAVALNDTVMGGIAPANPDREIQVSVTGGSAIDYIDVLHNNRVIHRESVFRNPDDENDTFKVYVEMGWAEQASVYPWDVRLSVTGGQLLDVEPRLRGYGPSVSPDDDNFAYTTIDTGQANCVHLTTHTRRNQSLHTASTEGFSVEIEGTPDTCVRAEVNDHTYELRLSELITGARTFYMGGFVSPAICFHRAVPASEYRHHFTIHHENHTADRDWYYVRVRQHNNQWAWSSPIWVNGDTS